MTTETQGAPEGVTEDVSVADQAPEDTTQAQGDEQSGDDGAAAQADGDKPRRQTAQERIDELTRLRREAERDAEYWRSKALQPEQRQEAPPEPQGDGRPDPAQYPAGRTDPDYIEDLASWKADQAVQIRLQQVDSERATRQAVETFETRNKTLYPEGEPPGLAAFRRIDKVPMAMQDVILTSDVGPKLADHLGSNPREFQRLSALPPHLQAYELAKVEATLKAPPAPQAKTVTDAPEPAPQARGAGGRFTVAPDTDDFPAFEKQFAGA